MKRFKLLLILALLVSPTVVDDYRHFRAAGEQHAVSR